MAKQVEQLSRTLSNIKSQQKLDFKYYHASEHAVSNATRLC